MDISSCAIADVLRPREHLRDLRIAFDEIELLESVSPRVFPGAWGLSVSDSGS